MFYQALLFLNPFLLSHVVVQFLREVLTPMVFLDKLSDYSLQMHQ